ncbi:ERF family protein [Lachnospiraceae bacterium LCP25S3_G4]
MNVYEKLLKVQSELKAPKNQYNKFGNFNYRNCEDIQEGAKPLLKEVGAVLIIDDDLVQIGDRFYVKATATFIDIESSEKVSNSAFAREELTKKGMDASQVTGATSSYARKYALNGLFCIDDSKDSDSDESTKVVKNTLIAEFNQEIRRTGKALSYFLKESKASSVEEMAIDYLSSAIAILSRCPDKGKAKCSQEK